MIYIQLNFLWTLSPLEVRKTEAITIPLAVAAAHPSSIPGSGTIHKKTRAHQLTLNPTQLHNT